MEICAKEKCTGCSACENICPAMAISMVANCKGFLYPVINVQKCVSCNKCVEKCPQNKTEIFGTEGKVLAALARKDSLREESSSGGVFTLLAEPILRKGGIVFGAAYDGMLVRHIAVTNNDDLCRLRGSKYVQSQIRHTYQEAKEFLDKKKTVLFSGTPCQIAGLKAYLGLDYENLLTIDILCHGVPSPAVFRTYVEYLEEKDKKKLVNIRFRNKMPGWKNFSTQLVFEDGETKNLISDSYMDGFLKNIYLRESCYHCPYASSMRIGDITLGDFWGYRESAPQYIMDDDRGISLVMINSQKGEKIFRCIRNHLAFAPRTVEDARNGNPILDHSNDKPDLEEFFWRYYPNSNWEQICNYCSLGKNVVSDYMSAEDRAYFAQPFNKRHPIHVLRQYKNIMLNRLRRK